MQDRGLAFGNIFTMAICLKGKAMVIGNGNGKLLFGNGNWVR